MWTTIKKAIMPLLFFAFFACLPFVGSCSEAPMYRISESELQALENHLSSLKENNETLLHLLNASELDLSEASQSLSESKKELATLKAQLETLQSETRSLSELLKTANEELRRASETFKASEHERDKIENRLRTQRNIWEALFTVAVGVAAAR